MEYSNLYKVFFILSLLYLISFFMCDNKIFTFYLCSIINFLKMFIILLVYILTNSLQVKLFSILSITFYYYSALMMLTYNYITYQLLN